MRRSSFVAFALAALAVGASQALAAQDPRGEESPAPAVEEAEPAPDPAQTAAPGEEGGAQEGGAQEEGIEEDPGDEDPSTAETSTPLLPPWEHLRELLVERNAGADRADPSTFHRRWRMALREAAAWARVQAATEAKPIRAAELAWIERWCVAEDVLAQHAPWRFDPAWHLAPLAASLGSPPGARVGAEGIAEYTARLDALPSELLRIEGILTGLTASTRDEGRALTADLLELLARPIPALEQEDDGDPTLIELERARDRALRAATAFDAWLASQARLPDAPPPLPDGDWERLAARGAGRPVDVDTLSVRLYRLLRELGEPAATAPPAPAPTPAPLSERFEKAAARGAQVGESLGWCEPGAARAEWVRAYEALSPRSAEALELRSVDADRWAFALRPGRADWPEAARVRRDSELSGAQLHASSWTLGLPGEAWFESAAVPSNLGIELLARGSDGLAGLVAGAVARATDAGQVQVTAAEREALRVLRRTQVARILAGLELHARRIPEERVVEELAQWTGWDPWTTQAEVSAIQRDPARGLGVLRGLDLLDGALRAGAAGTDPAGATGRVVGLLRRLPWAPADLIERLAR